MTESGGDDVAARSLDILPEVVPPKRTRVRKTAAPAPEAAAPPPPPPADPPKVAPPADAPTPVVVVQQATPQTSPAPAATGAPQPMPADPFQPAPVEVAEPPVSEATADPYPASPDAPAAEAPPAEQPPATAEQPAVPQGTPGNVDHSAGVRALQEAFAIDVAEREDRHRAEIRAMQQSFMTDVATREERHRAEVQVLHQRLAAEIAERDERHRSEITAANQTLETTRTQLTDVTSHRDREAQARAAHEVELERLRAELDTQASEIARLNARGSDLASSLAATRQQADQWNERARLLEAELATARADAEQAAAEHATKYGDKSRVLEETTNKLEDTARKLAVAEERGNRLADQSAAHEAAAAQLRNTVAEQRAERERVTGERDEARQQAADFEAQLRRVEFEAEQADEEANRHLNDASRKIEVLEEHIARVSGQVTVHEATIEELRRAAADAQIEMKKVTVDRDAAKRRIATLEAEVSRLEREATPGLIVSSDRDESSEAAADATDQPDAAPVADFDVVPINTGDKPLALADEIELLDWQREALSAWAARGHRGVVEAVTGAGKTELAYWAIADALEQDMKVLVIAPTAARVDHWYDGLRTALPINRVGKWTGGKDEQPHQFDVVVTTAANAATERVSGATFEGLIVADQVHAYGTRDLALALDPRYAWRLGLTAVYERDDPGVATYLEPFFGGVCSRLGYQRALADEVVAPYDLAVVAVTLTNAEQADYDALGEQAKTLAAELVDVHGVPAEPPHEFATAVVALAEGRMGPPRTTARAYQKSLAKQVDIVTKAAAKASVLKTLAEHIRTDGPALVFAETQDDATQIAKVLGAAGCATRPVSGVGERKLLGRKSDDSPDGEDIVLAAGATSGEPGVGIIVGANQSKLQLIQRVGHVVRKGSDARTGRVVVLYVEGTPEDGYSAPDAALTTAVAPHAARQQRFGASDSVALLEFLAGADASDESDGEPAE
ncbi:MAG: DEAD/DEAH box helicase family protein [Mycobacteriales bacterium]